MSNLNCRIGGIFNLIIISTSCVEWQAILKICEEFGVLYDLKFNVVKSCAGCVGRSRRDIGARFFL